MAQINKGIQEHHADIGRETAQFEQAFHDLCPRQPGRDRCKQALTRCKAHDRRH